MSSSGSSGSKGGNWQYRLQFSPDPDDSTNYILLTHSELTYEVSDFIHGTRDKIEGMWIYTTALAEWMPKIFGIQHEFVVIESENYYWSFEVNQKYISVQRSTDLNEVKQRYHGHDRGNKVSQKGSFSNKERTGYTIRDVFNWICEKRYLDQEYDFLIGNCKFFASLLFENFNEKFNLAHVREAEFDTVWNDPCVIC